MKNNELTHKQKDKKLNKFNVMVIILPIIFILIIAIILYYYTVIYNSDQNRTMRALTKEGYTCGKNVCTKEIDGDKYSYDAKHNLLSVYSQTFEFLMEDKSYTYNDLKKGNYCAYTSTNFTKGDKVDKTFTYSSPCEDYFNDVNEIIGTYAKIQNLE